MKYGTIQEGLAAYQNAAVSQEEAELETSALVTGGSPEDTKPAISATGVPVNMKKVFIAFTAGLAIGAILMGAGAPNSVTSSSLSGTPSSSTTASDLRANNSASSGGGALSPKKGKSKRVVKKSKSSKKTAKPSPHHEDLVKHMPGYHKSKLPTKQYSGYLNPMDGCNVSINGPDCKVHYVLALAEVLGEEDDEDLKYDAAMSAPTILWMNGGPGLSSLVGFYTELGPLLFNQNGDGLLENPYSWTKAGVNLLVLESPLGVGFSYCSNQFDTAVGSCKNSDVSTAKLNKEALIDFFTNKFPELSNNDFYILGESYAGVYVPTLAKEILSSTNIQLKGIAVGDPCTDNESQKQSVDRLWYSNKNGLLDPSFYDTITSDECKGYVSTFLEFGYIDDETPTKCIVAYRKILMSTSNGLAGRWPERYIDRNGLYSLVEKPGPGGKPHQKLMAYMDRQDVRKALNMDNSPVKQWCYSGRDGGTMEYQMQYEACTFHRPKIDFPGVSMVDIYREISPQLDKTWIYNADADPNIPYEGTMKASEKIGFSVVPGCDFRPWFYKKDPVKSRHFLFEKPITYDPVLIPQDIQPQFGGEVINYEHGVSFFTVHGSGHMVPMIRPEASLHFLKKFVGTSTSSSSTMAATLLSPPLPSDQVLADSSEKEFQEMISNWTEQAKSPPYV